MIKLAACLLVSIDLRRLDIEKFSIKITTHILEITVEKVTRAKKNRKTDKMMDANEFLIKVFF